MSDFENASYDYDQGKWIQKVHSIAKDPSRPKRNTMFSLFMMVAGLAGMIAFAVLATQAETRKASCPCTQMIKYMGNGERTIDKELCKNDVPYQECLKKETATWKQWSGLAGGSAGVCVLGALLLRFS
jgi:hypothetical protein